MKPYQILLFIFFMIPAVFTISHDISIKEVQSTTSLDSVGIYCGNKQLEDKNLNIINLGEKNNEA